MKYARRLRWLILLAGAVAACGQQKAIDAPPGLSRVADARPAEHGPCYLDPEADGIVCPAEDVCIYDAATDDMVCPVQSAVFPVNVTAMKMSVWSYYTGSTTAGLPGMTMFPADHACPSLDLGGGKRAYRIGRFLGVCLPDIAQVSTTAFYATYEEWGDRWPVPGAVQPWYATLAINMLCIAAYKQAGYTDAQLGPYCSGDPTSTVPNVRRWIHDTYYPDTPYWQ